MMKRIYMWVAVVLLALVSSGCAASYYDPYFSDYDSYPSGYYDYDRSPPAYGYYYRYHPYRRYYYDDRDRWWP